LDPRKLPEKAGNVPIVFPSGLITSPLGKNRSYTFAKKTLHQRVFDTRAGLPHIDFFKHQKYLLGDQSPLHPRDLVIVNSITEFVKQNMTKIHDYLECRDLINRENSNSNRELDLGENMGDKKGNNEKSKNLRFGEKLFTKEKNLFL